MSSKVLSTSLRPRSLSHLYGQDETVKAIRKHMEKRPPAAWMFHGSSGTGKTTIASIMAIAFQCPHMKLWGDPCDACWKAKASFAIHEISGSDVTGIDELRNVVEMSKYRPTNPDGKRVIILDEAQKISNSAMNMLLVPFEKPPAHAVWIICTTEPNKILVTLQRRCVAYQMKPLGVSAAEAFLTKQAARAGITRPLALLFEQCHLMQVTAPAILLMALEKFAAGASATDAVTGADGSGLDTYRICKAVTNGSWKDIAVSLKDATPDQSRLIRASVAGWIKGCMARATSSPELDRHSASLLELCQPPIDDATMAHWLWGTLWRISKRYKEVQR